MRQLLSALTLRGRSFLAAGIAAALCSLLLGERILLRIGLLLVVLPLAAVIVVARTRYRLTARRVLESPRVPAGHEAHVALRVDNVSRLPTGLLLVEESVPYQLGSAPRFVLDRVEPHGVREIGYTLRSDIRGRFDIGPLSVRLADPFGLVELTRSFAQIDKLTVTPLIHPLPEVRLSGDWTGGGDSHARTIAAAGDDDVATREYRRGDDLRRVHWKTTAKRGELMVRREEQHWQSRCTIFLDSRHRAYHGDGPGSAFEFAVSAAASIGIALARQGFGLRLVTDAGASFGGYGGLADVSGGPLEGMLLEELAVIKSSRRLHLTDGITAASLSGGEGLLVAVLGALDDSATDDIARMRQGRGTGVALLVDSASWTTSRRTPADLEHEAAVIRRLRTAGWRVVPVSHGTPLARVWPLAGGGYAAEAVAEPSTGART
ncbi:MAG: DUF58 domain-containing protein [Streptosporangiales bacterium]|nr:DUF58 domain-containing protein [Streptosporangiales bacterium]